MFSFSKLSILTGLPGVKSALHLAKGPAAWPARLVSPSLPGPALRVASRSNPDRGGGGGRETEPGSGRNSFQGAEGVVPLEAAHPRGAGRGGSVLPGRGDFSDAGACPRSLGSGRSPPHLSLFPLTVLHLTAGRGQQRPAGVPLEKVEWTRMFYF